MGRVTIAPGEDGQDRRWTLLRGIIATGALVVLASSLVTSAVIRGGAGPLQVASAAPKRVTGHDVGHRVAIVEPSDDPYSWGFEPFKVTVQAGAAVRWRNVARHTHTVTADDGSFGSPNLKAGSTWEWTFEAPGEYRYHCSPHPWMKGIVKVVRRR